MPCPRHHDAICTKRKSAPETTSRRKKKKRAKKKLSLRGGVPNRPAGLQKEPAGIRLGRREEKQSEIMVDSRRRIGGISLASVRVSRRHRLRLVPPPLQPAPLLHGTNDNAQLRDDALTLLTVRRAERAPQKRTCADSAQGDRRACHGARANPVPRGARRRRDGCDWRREASRPSQARRSGGWIAPRG